MTNGSLEIPEALRGLAQQSVRQAKQAFDQFMGACARGAAGRQNILEFSCLLWRLLKESGSLPGKFLFGGRRGPGMNLTTRQYARLVSEHTRSAERKLR